MNVTEIDMNELCRTLHVFREKLIQEELFKEVCTQCIGPSINVESGSGMCGFEKVNSQQQTDGAALPCSQAEINREQLIGRIEEVIEDVIRAISRQESPSLSYGSTRTWDNVSFQAGSGLMHAPKIMTTIRFDSHISINKFALTIKILSIIHRLLRDNTYCTKRDLYYQNVELFGSQSAVDGIVDNISCMLSVPRWQLHVLATSKGCLAGDLQFRDSDDNLVDCSKTDTGVLVPNHVTGISHLTTNAKFVLVVEKDATFQSLLDDFFCLKFQAIIITGKGFPDVNTRLLLRRIWEAFHLPTFALMDADPHGVEIMAVYKFGSRAMSFETANLALPSLKWLGVLPSDVDKLQISRDALICLSDNDIEKAKDLLRRPYVAENGPLRNEVELILKRGFKAEIQCLTSLGPRFLTDIYIPNKILSRAWI